MKGLPTLVMVIFVFLAVAGFVVLNYSQQFGGAGKALPANSNNPSAAVPSKDNQGAGNDAEMELKKQIGQMLIVGFRGTEISKDSAITGQIKDLNLGGVILFDFDNPSKSYPRNIINPSQTKELIKNLQSYSLTPLFIALDAEGGLINRLKAKYGFIPIPSAQEMGETGNLAKTEATSEELGSELKELGFNLNFAPVVDVNVNPDNPVIGKLERSFSSDPQKVSSQAEAFIKGQRSNYIISAIKHFPGHGSASSDSHLGLVDVTKTYQQKELIPFKALISGNLVDMVMTAHIMDAKVDPDYPATLSPAFLQNILRKQLRFEGIIVSDDMQMGAIVKNYGFKEALIRAINAGCDLLILSNNGDVYDEDIANKASNIIFEAIKGGAIDKDKIEESLARIKAIKEKFKIIQFGSKKEK